MGIRMRLAVGYGLNLKKLGLDTTGLGWDKAKGGVAEDEAAFKAFVQDVNRTLTDEIDPMILRHAMQLGNKAPLSDALTDLHQMFVYEPEFGDEGKLLLIPAGYHTSWIRYGDLLDAFLYETQVHFNDGAFMQTEWRTHPGGLYPFVGLMRAAADGIGIEQYNVPCYLGHPEHKNAIPFAPLHLRLLIKHLKLIPKAEFSEQRLTEVFLSLRPKVYRYWS